MKKSKYSCKGNITLKNILKGESGVTKSGIAIDNLFYMKLMSTIMMILFGLGIAQTILIVMRHVDDYSSQPTYYISHLTTVAVGAVGIRLLASVMQISLSIQIDIEELCYNNYVSPIFDYLNTLDFDKVLEECGGDTSKAHKAIIESFYTKNIINKELMSDKMDKYIDTHDYQDYVPSCFVQLKKTTIKSNKFMAKVVSKCLNLSISMN